MTVRDDLRKLEAEGFFFIEPKSQYETARMKGPCTVVLYTTGKLSLQGTPAEVSKVRSLIGIAEKKPVEKQTVLSDVIIGSDESLKGDTFGGLVVAGFRADRHERQRLKEIGVADSKTLDDFQILSIARKLREEFKGCFVVLELFPSQYNSLLKDSNVTEMLDDLHRKAYVALKTPGSVHIVDKYPGCGVGDICETKAESLYPEVAAASILAREKAIMQLNELSAKAGFVVPRGSAHVEKALEEIKIRGIDPSGFVKLNFSNVRSFFY